MADERPARKTAPGAVGAAPRATSKAAPRPKRGPEAGTASGQTIAPGPGGKTGSGPTGKAIPGAGARPRSQAQHRPSQPHPPRPHPPRPQPSGPRPRSQAEPAPRPEAGSNPGTERIAKLLARAGVASRREVERMIAEGRIKRDGVLVTTPATTLADLRGVTVDGQIVAMPERTRLFAFHKPAGLITAEKDPAGRPTIYNALRNALPGETPRLMPVGRLDYSTEGLLLLTNDGEFKRQLELPSTGVPRTYRARAFGVVSQAQLEDLAEGITIDGMHYGPIEADLERRTGRNQWIILTLREGKNREVRRVLEHLGLEVSRLLRTAYGPFHLGDLGRGQAQEITKEDIERFCSTLGRHSGKQSGAGGRAGGNRPG